MKKKRLIAALAIASLFSLTSCIILNGYNRFNPKDLTYTFTEEDEKKLRDSMSAFEKEIKGNSIRGIVTSWNTVNNMAYSIQSMRTIEHINYAKGDSSAYEKYAYFNELLNDIISWEEKQYKSMAESSFRDQFFQGYTDEEIEELINSVKPDEYYEIEEENEKLIKEYNDLTYDTEEALSEYNTKVPDIYKALVKNYNQEASLLGYSDYMEMAYKNTYSREYSVADVESFNVYVKDTILPLYETMQGKLKDLANTLTEEEKENVKKFQQRGSKSFNNYSDYLVSYSNFLGGAYEKNFKTFRNDGYLIFGEDNANIDAAFTTYLYDKSLNKPIMYLGPSYQDVMTYVHEFGHYNSFVVNGAGAMSYDLAETQSQGNELLFIAYLQDKEANNNSYTYIAYNQVTGALQTVLMASIVNEFERRVYQANDIDSIDFDNLYVEVGDYFGGYERIMKSIYGDTYGSQIDYWKRVALSNAGYYISYAMSNIPSLEIYSLALTDMSEARKAYTSVYAPASEYTQEDFLKVIEAANLYSPFDEEAYKLINKLGE